VSTVRAELPPMWTRFVPSATVTLRDPQDISVSPEGLLYVADTGHHRVIAVDSLGKLVAETGGFGSGHGQFEWPRQVIAAWGSSVWVLDYGNRRIERFSRSLEYQGTLEITVPGDETRHQPQAMALSPQGDLYVFDRDDGRLVRYDPLFTVQAELGSGSGLQFVSNVAAMTFVSSRGLWWCERGGRELRHTDALLNPAATLTISDPSVTMSLGSIDTCLITASMTGAVIHCDVTTPADTVISSAEFRAVGLRSVQAIAVSSGKEWYLLDGAAATIYRIRGIRH
jgi:sugar lactone lactonase YvrE